MIDNKALELFKTLHKKITKYELDVWAKKPYWTEIEALTLVLFGINPEKFHLQCWEDMSFTSEKKKLIEFLDLLGRSVKSKELTPLKKNVDNTNIREALHNIADLFKNPNRCFVPLNFINWVQKFQKPNKHLIKMVTKYSGSVNWETKYKELEAKFVDLKKEIKTKPLHGSEKSTYQKIIFILLYNGYGLKKFEDQPFDDNLQVLLKDAQSLRDDADLKLPFKLPCDKTITLHYNTIKELFQKKLLKKLK